MSRLLNKKVHFFTVLFVLYLSFIIGCSHPFKMTYSDLTATEQLLITRSLERAADRLNLEQFGGQNVLVEIYSLSENKDFAKEFLINKFEQKGITVVSDKAKADREIKTFVLSMGIDRNETLFGTPALTTPIGVSIPEIALYKSERTKGYCEIKTYVYDGEKKTFLPENSESGIGKSTYNAYTFLIFFSFERSDIYNPDTP